MLKKFAIALILAASASAGFGQASEQVLVIVGGQKIAVKDLPASVARDYENLATTVAESRKELLEVQVIDILAESEAAARKLTVEQLFELEVNKKVPDPGAKEIEDVYNANRAAIGNRPLSEVRDQIVNFLRSEPEQKVFAAFVSALKAKYKVVSGRNVNTPNLAPGDVIATVGGKPITSQMFETKNRVALYEIKAKVYDRLKFELNRLLLSALATAEAKTLGVEPYQFLGAEITDKMREFSDEERAELESALRRRLSAKYRPQWMYNDPAPIVFTIPTDGQPTIGPATAPVTVVVFADFQCSSCAAKNPILKRVVAEYGQQVRLVARNFPLTAIHKDALNAARAAEAAAIQGKFFEYIELLYSNQGALDITSLKKYAVAVGLNPQKFELDFQSTKVASEVDRDIADGKAIGINGTPAVYVNGIKVRINTAEGFRDAIDAALKK